MRRVHLAASVLVLLAAFPAAAQSNLPVINGPAFIPGSGVIPAPSLGASNGAVSQFPGAGTSVGKLPASGSIYAPQVSAQSIEAPLTAAPIATIPPITLPSSNNVANAADMEGQIRLPRQAGTGGQATNQYAGSSANLPSLGSLARLPAATLSGNADGYFLYDGETPYVLQGLKVLAPDQICGAPTYKWRCGEVALARFQELTGGNQMDCMVVGHYANVAAATCRITGVDPGLILISEGLASAGDNAPSRYLAAQERARHSRSGMWGR